MWAVLLFVGVFFLAWLSDRMEYPDDYKKPTAGKKTVDFREPPYYSRKELKRPLPYDPEADALYNTFLDSMQDATEGMFTQIRSLG